MPRPARLARASRFVSRPAAMATALLVLAPLGPQALPAQSLTGLEFSLSNPGARSLGFGGAFVALADDATAAFANPAGLVQIAEPEVSVEGRFWSYRTPFTRGGRADGTPTGLGIDTVAEPLYGESANDLDGLSFLSMVYPRGRWSIALFQHQLANFEFSLETQGVLGAGSGPTGAVRTVPGDGRIDLEILTRGLAVAFRPNDALSFGLGLSYFEPSAHFQGRDYAFGGASVESYFEEVVFRSDRLVQTVEYRWEEPKSGLSAGFLLRLSERWTLGGVYRETPALPIVVDVVAGGAHPQLPAGTRLVDGFRTAWDFPDVYALGLGYRSPDGRWTVAGEWRRVEYSSILESLLPQQREGGLALDDADEIHLGGEYAFFAGSSVLAVRLGVWHDPGHYFGITGDDPVDRALFAHGEDELHFAAGLGAALRRFQVDLGIDLSRRIDTASLSIIYSFGS